MHHRVRHVEDERLSLVAFVLEIINRLVGVKAGETGHVARLAGSLVVLMKCHCAAVIRPQRTEVIVKTLCIGHPRDDHLSVGDIPLADTGRLVVRFSNQLGEGDLARRHSPTLAAKWIASGQQRRARRPAHRLRIKTGEPGSLLGQPIHARCLVLLVAVTAHIRIALIVGENDEDVRPRSIGVERRARGEECKGAQDDKSSAFFHPDSLRV